MFTLKKKFFNFHKSIEVVKKGLSMTVLELMINAPFLSKFYLYFVFLNFLFIYFYEMIS